MSRMLLAPGRYIQGAGAINEIGSHAVNLGTKALVTGGKTALSITGPAIMASLEGAGVGALQENFRIYQDAYSNVGWGKDKKVH